MPPRALVVDDDEAVRRAVERALEGYDVTAAADGLEAQEQLKKAPFDVVVTDLRMPRCDGYGVLRALEQLQPHVPAIVLTGEGTISECVAAMKAGAAEFVTKPVRPKDLRRIVDGVLEDRAGAKPETEGQLRELPSGTVLVGSRLDEVVQLIEQIADHDATVLITGESGTGKEVVARLLHAASSRAAGPYIAVNCAAIPDNLIESELFGHARGAFTGATEARDGLFVRADGGTLFLDEIGDLPLALQVKLVRVLQEREVTPVGGNKSRLVDVRIVAATLRDLDVMVEEGRFREDLYYRLTVIPIQLPPLRESPDDIVALAQHFVRQACARYRRNVTLTPSALAILRSYSWPGNVRQLENLVQRLVLTARGPTITPEALPEKVRQATSELVMKSAHTLDRPVLDAGIDLPQALADFERNIIVQALELAEGNKSKAATLLNVNRTTLIDKLKRYGLG